MMFFIKNLLLASGVTLALALMFVAAPVFAGVNCNDPNLPAEQAIQCGTDAAAGTSRPASQATDDLNDLIKNIIQILSIVVGIIAVVMIILGGFRYVTSGGDATKVQSAKNTLLYAVIGLVIALLAQIIARFVLQKAAP